MLNKSIPKDFDKLKNTCNKLKYPMMYNGSPG